MARTNDRGNDFSGEDISRACFELLLRLFAEAEDLRRSVRLGVRITSLSPHLPSSPVSLASLAHDLIELVRRRGIEQLLFEHLIEEFPSHEEEIKAVATLWIPAFEHTSAFVRWTKCRPVMVMMQISAITVGLSLAAVYRPDSDIRETDFVCIAPRMPNLNVVELCTDETSVNGSTSPIATRSRQIDQTAASADLAPRRDLRSGKVGGRNPPKRQASLPPWKRVPFRASNGGTSATAGDARLTCFKEKFAQDEMNERLSACVNGDLRAVWEYLEAESPGASDIGVAPPAFALDLDIEISANGTVFVRSLNGEPARYLGPGARNCIQEAVSAVIFCPPGRAPFYLSAWKGEAGASRVRRNELYYEERKVTVK